MSRMPGPAVRDVSSLLDRIRTEALDPGYTRAHERRTERPPGAGPGRVIKIVIPLVVLGLLVATATAQARRTAPDRANERAALAERIDRVSAEVEALHEQVEQLRAEVAAARDARLQITDEGRQLSAQLEELERAAGAVPVTGPGLRIVVDDAEVQGQQGRQVQGTNRVLDTDLQQLVNGLWAAGAEAVAINGYRLTSTTAIRAAGEAIVVAFRPLSRPYIVEAIGDPRQLEARFVDGPGGRWFRTLQDNYGVVFTVATEETIRLPAASDIALTHASPADQSAGAGTDAQEDDDS